MKIEDCKELIAEIRGEEEIERKSLMFPTKCWSVLFRSAEAIETMLSERKSYGWISVSERLSDKDDAVLAVSANTSDMAIAQYCGNGIFLDYGDV